ncbi:secretin N-terminal domain-containing protein [Deinococcus caeni]|uniref:secretin N-terminal domain-containing protein n=1 Tax=Deinococcus caeni TaxID=569127 RepID=UPI0036239AEB
MTKRFAFLLLTAALGMAAAQTSTPLNNTETSVRNATADKNLTAARITVNTGSYVGPLSVLLSGVAKGAGYEVVFNFNVDALALINGEIIRANTPTTPSAGSTGSTATSGQPQNSSPIAYATPVGRPLELPAKPVTHVFNNVPFNEVWPLLMDVYELDYEVVRLGSVNVIRVGQKPRQLSITLSNITATQARDRATEFFGEEYYDEIETTVGDAVSKTKVFKGYKLPSTIRILADVENNRIIVGGSNEESDKVRSFISTIDVQRQVSSSVPQGQAVYGVNGSSSPVSTLQARFPGLQLTSIGTGDRILISGPQTQIDEALKLLAIIDPPQSTGNLPNQTVQRVYAVKGAQADIVAVLAAQYPGLKVTPVGQTGQLVITGPQNQLDAAVALLGQVDRVAPVVAGAQITQRVFQLVNASAEEVKATLEGKESSSGLITETKPATVTETLVTLPGQAGAVTGGVPASSANAQTATNQTATSTFSVVADKRTNIIVVRGTAEQIAMVEQLIPNLDQRVPQINVQVRIQEVTETASRSLGMDWKAGFGVSRSVRAAAGWARPSIRRAVWWASTWARP